jgi:HAE1 family hydrophobic/amphiphilic exporter-1
MVGGLILSQAMTLFTTPVVYLYLDRFTGARRHQRASERAHASGQTPVTPLAAGMTQGLSQ